LSGPDPLHRGGVPHAARQGERAHLAGHRLDRLESPPAGDHVRAGLGELDGDCPADPLAGAGHDRDAVL
jgi:hypothetical protein